MINFTPDLPVQFKALTDGRMTADGIEVIVGLADIDGRKTATLINDGAKVLVRLNRDGTVNRFIPTSNDVGTYRIFVAISSEFGVALIAGPEDVNHFGSGDLEMLSAA